MADGNNGSFWTSLPGVITATATLVTALGALFVTQSPKSSKTFTDSTPTVCDVKGNVSSDGRKIYHMPSDRDYSKVKINKGDEKMFCSAAEAEAEGWTRTPH